jgi:hypothetical protein
VDKDRALIDQEVNSKLTAGIRSINDEVKAQVIQEIDAQLKDIQAQIKTATSSRGRAQLKSGDATIQGYIDQSSKKYDVSTELATRLVNQESGGRQTNEDGTTLQGPANKTGERAQGLTQLLPSTAKGLGVDPSDPAQNVDGGIRYYSQLLQQFGNQADALAAYNWGPANVQAWIANGRNPGKLPAETKKYVQIIGGGTADTSGLYNQARSLTNQKLDAQGASDTERAAALDELDQQQSRAKVGTDFNRPVQSRATNPAQNFGDQLSSINANAGIADKNTQSQIDYLTSFISAAQGAKNFPAATLQAKQDQLRKLRQQADQAEAKIESDKLDKLNTLLADEQKSLATLTASRDDLAKQYNVGPGLTSTFNSEGERKDVEKKLADLDKEIQSVQGEVTKTVNDIGKTQSNVTKFSAEGDARSAAATPNDRGVGAGIQDAASSFAKKYGVDDPTEKSTADIATSVFDGVDKSFSSFVTNFVTGNNKAKQSFADFARSLVSSAASALANKAVSSLLSSVFSAVGGAAGGAGGILGSLGSLLGGGGSSGGSWDNAVQAYHGTVIERYSDGGMVPGVHVGRDTVPALLAPGEAVLNRSAVGMVGSDMINAMNAGAMSRGAGVPSLPAPQAPPITNVYVVDKNTQPTLGPNDVLATVHADILSGGATKKLIKQVGAGQI